MASAFGFENEFPTAEDQAAQQTAGLGGAGWLSAIPAILGAGASFRNPQAGVALMGIANFLRQQRMEEIAQQRLAGTQAREQRMQDLQEQRQNAAVEHYGKLGFTVPQGMTPAEATAAYNAYRLQQHETEQLARRDRSAQALSGLTGLESQTQMDPRSVYQAAVGLVKSIGSDQAPTVLPIINRMREQMVRQGQAEQMLPAPRPPEQYGPSQVDPEDAQKVAAQYGRGEVQSIPAWLERTGRNPALAGPEGQKFLTERDKMMFEREKASHDTEDLILKQRHSMGLPLTRQERQRIGVLGQTPYEPSQQSYAGYAVGVDPGDISGASPKDAAEMARRASESYARLEGFKGATKIRMETPAKVAESYAQIAPAAARTTAVGNAETGVLSMRGKRLAEEKLGYPELVHGPFAGPGGEIIPSRIATPHEQAQPATGGSSFVKVSPKDEQRMEELNNIRGIVGIVDEQSKQLITARTGGAAAGQGIKGWAQSNPTVPFLGIKPLSILQRPLESAYAATKAGFTGQLSRTFGGERGVLTEQDVQRVVALLPDFTDTQQTRDIKMGFINNIVEQSTIAQRRKLAGLPLMTGAEITVPIKRVIEQALDRTGTGDPASEQLQGQSVLGAVTGAARRRFNPQTGQIEAVKE